MQPPNQASTETGVDTLPGIAHIVLLGLMGTGKSTVGRLVASRLGRPFRDSDLEIEARLGRTVREIAAAEGDEAMHDIEAAQLLGALLAPGPDVLAAAASIADRPECLDALRGPGIAAVWLDVDPAIAAARFDSRAHRPRFGDDPAVFLAAQRAARGPKFRSVAKVVLDGSHATPDALADLLLRRLADPAGG
ncbi:MAG: shikimate kinase [Chloroflexota bacterium]